MQAPPAVAPAAAAAPAKPTPDIMRQFPALPQKSPSAEVTQQVGVTDITVRYSSPGVNGRKIWGELVPFGKVWRVGANAPTRLSWTNEATFGGKPIPAGSYTLLTIPTEAAWTVILSRDPEMAGAAGYQDKHDVVRFEVTPTDAPPRERMAFLFEDMTDEGAKLVLEWAGKRVVMPIQVDTKKHVQKSIDDTMSAVWRPHFNAGRYVLDNEKDPKRALALFEQSIAIRSSWWNHWWAAETLAKLDKKPDALKHAEKARELGKGDMTFERNFAEQVNKAIADWGKK